MLALHPTHIDVTGIGAPGQLLATQIKRGEGSVVPSTPQIPPLSPVSPAPHLPSQHPSTAPRPHPLVPQLCGCGRFQLYLVQVVSTGKARSVRLGDPPLQSHHSKREAHPAPTLFLARFLVSAFEIYPKSRPPHSLHAAPVLPRTLTAWTHPGFRTERLPPGGADEPRVHAFTCSLSSHLPWFQPQVLF